MVGRALLAVVVVAILAATLWPLPHLPHGDDADALMRWRLQPADVARNVLLFLPVGALLWPRSPRFVLLFAAALSGLIEAAQLLLPGRVPSPWDLAANVGGAFLGHAVARRVARVGWRDEGLHRRAFLLWAGLATTAIALGPVGFRPAPPPPPWYAHVPPDLGHLEPYAGRIDSATLDGHPIAHGLIEREDVADRWTGPHALHVRGVAGAAPARVAGLFLVTDHGGQEVAMLGLHGPDLFYRVRGLGAALGFELPLLVWPDALAGLPPGGPLAISARKDGATVCLGVADRERCDLGPRPADGWQHWLPAQALGRALRRGLGPAWWGLWFVPLGAGLRARPLEIAGLLGVLAAVALAPRLGPVAPVGPASAATIAVALGLGAALGRWVRGARTAGPAPGRPDYS